MLRCVVAYRFLFFDSHHSGYPSSLFLFSLSSPSCYFLSFPLLHHLSYSLNFIALFRVINHSRFPAPSAFIPSLPLFSASSLIPLFFPFLLITSSSIHLENYNPNTQQAYRNSASFVPKLATKVLGWLNVQKDDLVLDLGCGGELFVCFLFCFWASVGGEGA